METVSRFLLLCTLVSVLKTTFKDLKSGLRQYLGDAIIKRAFGNQAI